MYDAVLVGCRWLEQTPWGATIRASSWLYPVVLWLHFVGLSVWLATSVIVDLRLLGVGARRQTAAELSNGLFGWNWAGFTVACAAGFVLLSAEATTYAANVGFWLKLAVLTPMTVICRIAVQRKMRRWSETGHTALAGRWAGAIELMLWVSVISASVIFLLTNAVTHP